MGLLVPEVALARGGGGGHSSGGGSSGGSSGSRGSSSSSSGSGSSGFFFVGNSGSGGGNDPLGSIFGGICCLVVFLVVLFLIIRAVRKAGKTPDAPGVDPSQYAAPPVPVTDPTQGLAEIQANDPGFNVERFRERTNLAFFQLQKAWMDRNVDEGRAYMSPGLYGTWKVQVDQLIANHTLNRLDNLLVEGLNIVKATHDANYDEITVRIDASATDYEVDDQTGKEKFAVGGKKGQKPFTEYWTFQRSAGAKTLLKPGVTDKKCPNCGAPSDVNETGHCRYCNAEITSGKFDWVLSRITQAHEWRG